jgi:hypothetical protein
MGATGGVRIGGDGVEKKGAAYQTGKDFQSQAGAAKAAGAVAPCLLVL